MTASLPENRYSFPVKTARKAVEAFWLPLTPEHGFPSLSSKAQGAPPQPEKTVLARIPPFQKKKTGDARRTSPVKNQAMTSYGGIIRIR